MLHGQIKTHFLECVLWSFVSVILDEFPFKDWHPDSQRYPLNLWLIEDEKTFLFLFSNHLSNCWTLCLQADSCFKYKEYKYLFSGNRRKLIISFDCVRHRHDIEYSNVLMQGKLIAVAYTLRTYWNQFSLGGICKQE